jgi:hypothetical protein
MRVIEHRGLINKLGAGLKNPPLKKRIYPGRLVAFLFPFRPVYGFSLFLG